MKHPITIARTRQQANRSACGRPADSEDPKIEIDTEIIAQWFPHWSEQYKSHRRAVDEINAAVRKKLLNFKDVPKNPIGTEQTFRNWLDKNRNKRLRATSRHHSYAFAFLQITGVDITKDQLFSRGPLNFTPLATLSGVVARRLSNYQEKGMPVAFRVELPSLTFKDQAIPVTARHFGRSTATEEVDGVAPDKEVGTVHIGLLSAILSIDSHANIEPGFVRLRDGESELYGKSDGCDVIIEKSRQLAWMISKLPTDIRLFGVLEDLEIGQLRTSKAVVISLKILVEDPSSISTIFNVKTEFEKSEMIAREQLISQVLAQRWNHETDYVLCFGTVDVGC